MSIPVSDPGRDYPSSHAAKSELQNAIPHGRTIVATAVKQAEVNQTEPEALAQSTRNSSAPINRIPPEILSLIPDYYDEDDEDDADRCLIALTHVCRGWRDTFTSRALLWIRLDFRNVDKTWTYIQRSQSSPLEIDIGYKGVVDEAFLLVIPHIPRLRSLVINMDSLPNCLEHLYCNTPLLEKVDIDLYPRNEPILDSALFNGDLSSLHELRLHQLGTYLPWKNLANLRVIDIKSHSHTYGTTQVLDLLESAPLLHTVLLGYMNIIPGSPIIPPDRMVHLRHLKIFNIDTTEPQSTLLHHLHIPFGASLISDSYFRGEESPLLDYLPERYPNFRNLSHITAVNLLFDSNRKHARLSGPSGSLRVFAWREGLVFPSYTTDCRIIRSISHPILSGIQTLMISEYVHQIPAGVGECPIFRILSLTSDLRTLTLIDCNNLPFIVALDPIQNASNLVLCSNMEALALYIRSADQFHIQHLIDMAKSRASNGVKLSSITIVVLVGLELEELKLEEEILKLKEYATHVEYRVDNIRPDWDHVPGEGCSGDE